MKTHVRCVPNTASLAEAADVMDLYQLRMLPVLDPESRLIGVIGEADIRRAMQVGWDSPVSQTLLRNSSVALAGCVADWMAAPAVTAAEHEPIGEAAVRLWASGHDRLPVLSDAGMVTGLLSRIDVIQAVAEGLL
ncbi:MAG: CBS domain-containing protein [Armatimonadetes bacterium]|nr:CBS domain-containing protein [Armatimonadota bacterium]MDE2205433.1 CBS domain-containing protein [Armatimonadota bacterium]